MMWFDNDPKKGMDLKVMQASEYYRGKYGQTANVCLVNPKVLPEGQQMFVEGILVRSERTVLPGHLLIGYEEAR